MDGGVPALGYRAGKAGQAVVRYELNGYKLQVYITRNASKLNHSMGLMTASKASIQYIQNIFCLGCCIV